MLACSSKNGENVVSDSNAPASRPKRNAVAGSPSPVAPHPSRLLFVGTSLTAGLGLEPDSAYPALIQRKIDSAGLPFEVTNAGVSGETTAGLLERLDWLLRADFSVLVLESGANDGLRGIPTETMRRNLQTAIDRIRAKRPDARILLVQMEALPNLGPQYAREFHDVFPELARKNDIT